MERRNFIRALIGVAIGIPIVVEGVTFSRLFYERLVGAEPNDQRPEGEGVDVGEDLLPATDATETIEEMRLAATSESEWSFRLVVSVANETEQTYRLKLGPVSLGDGSTVGDTITTGEMAPGETTTLTGEWSVPTGSTVVGVWAGGKTGEESVTERVLLAPIDEPS